MLVLRPRQEAARTARALARRGHDAILAPLLQVEPFEGACLPVSLSAYTAAIAASPHAFTLLPPGDRSRLAELPAMVVGSRSARAAEKAGLRIMPPVHPNARSLAAALTEDPPAGRLLYLAGRERRPEIEKALQRQGRSFLLVEVYSAAVVPRLPPVAMSALRLREVGAVLHYSARSAEAYVALAKARRLLARALAPAQLCLSAAVAEPLLDAGAKRVEVAASPHEARLLALLPALDRASGKTG
ncbi:MAG: uroporphyrinogen-III synthase [Hyphomicrobiales bacterium]|nr:uroporphyrinogen-III synthase [Hyphomicrobiales bacterium]